jgi:hypothetical protein
MNEQALKDSYELFKQKGYTKSFDEYVNLINTNPDALNDSYTLFKEKGYGKSIEDFSTLVGVKKKTNPFLLLKRTLRNPLHQQSRKKLSHRMFQFQYKKLDLNQYKSKRFQL